MAYDLQFVPSAISDLERGDLDHVRAYGFTMRGVAYRVVYSVDDGAESVTVVALGAHDLAYRRARDR